MNRYDRLGLTLEVLEAKSEADRQASIAAWEAIATLPEGSTLPIRLPRDYVPLSKAPP
mgnify:CR=1 FL=1